MITPRPAPPPASRGDIRPNGTLWLSFGSGGGFMQSQAQVQILVNRMDDGLNPQPAPDVPRLRVNPQGVPEMVAVG
ncbi:MAG: gamma-glutamyltransferase [Anaerolineae bacterium]